MLQARLDALPWELRRVLRAASVLGETVWPGALRMLLDVPERQVDGWLEELVALEWIVRQPQSRRAGEAEYDFRHALLRDTAYGSLTAEDRALGHRLAGEWLARTGTESVAAEVAENFER